MASDKDAEGLVGPIRRISLSDYLPLTQLAHAQEFRLLKVDDDDSETLSCTVRRYKVHHAPPFRALSYTWKNPFDVSDSHIDTTEDIMIDGKPVSVGQNLVAALKAVRDWHSGHRAPFLWADAICIDQENVHERAYQVSIMGEIFGRANDVFVWLGGESQDSDQAMNFIKSLTATYKDHESSRAKVISLAQNPRHEKHWRALDALWRRRWWQRAWVLQEVVLARDAEFHCGRTSVKLDDIFDSTTLIRSAIDEVYSTLKAKYNIELNMPTFHGIDGMKRILNARLQGTLYPLTTCHYRTMSPQAHDQRDFLFAKLGMASDGSIVRPSYSDSVEDVYTDFVLEHIKYYNKLDIIHFDARPRKVPNLPSWVPDWSAGYAADPLQPDHGGNPDNNFPKYQASLDEPANIAVDSLPTGQKILICRGWVIDTVDGLARYEEESWAGKEVARPMVPATKDKCSYDSNEAIFEALWRALTIQSDLQGDLMDADSGLILAASFESACRRLDNDADNNDRQPDGRFEKDCALLRDFDLFGRTVRERMATAASDRSFSTATVTKVESAMMEWYTFRRLYSTKEGRIGTGPPEIEQGHTIAILSGCDVPVVLRPVEEGRYEIIGETYIQGVMNGEVMKKIRDEKLAPVTISLQ